MCLSFCLVLGVVGLVMNKKAPRQRRRSWVPPPVEEVATRQPDRASSTVTATGLGSSTPRPISSQIADLSLDAERLGSSASLPTDRAVSAAASLASRHIQQLRRDLSLQVSALKKSRDSMLDELAAGLTTMSPEKAAAELRVLDDESAGLVLGRLSETQRKAILKSLEPKRAQVLDRKARTWAAK